MSEYESVRQLMIAQNESPETIEKIMAIMEQAGRRHRRFGYTQDLTGPTWVYCIVDPRTRKPFYIGITKYLWYRFEQHRNDRCSAAWVRLNELLSYGYPPNQIYKPYRCCADRNEALRLEHRLINSVPGLLNRERRLSRVTLQ